MVFSRCNREGHGGLQGRDTGVKGKKATGSEVCGSWLSVLSSSEGSADSRSLLYLGTCRTSCGLENSRRGKHWEYYMRKGFSVGRKAILGTLAYLDLRDLISTLIESLALIESLLPYANKQSQWEPWLLPPCAFPRIPVPCLSLEAVSRAQQLACQPCRPMPSGRERSLHPLLSIKHSSDGSCHRGVTQAVLGMA